MRRERRKRGREVVHRPRQRKSGELRELQPRRRAGDVADRGQAAHRIEDHIRATEGIECRKDADVIDETPAAYKPIDAVMRTQSDLVEVVHTLEQVIVVKG